MLAPSDNVQCYAAVIPTIANIVQATYSPGNFEAYFGIYFVVVLISPRASWFWGRIGCNSSKVHFAVGTEMVNPFKTAVPLWGQTT